MSKNVTKLIYTKYFLGFSYLYLICAKSVKRSIEIFKNVKDTINIRINKRLCVDKIF